jgi:tetraacyldisaccharide 4'-kinase
LLDKSFFEDLIYGRTKSFLWGPLLFLFSQAYGAIIRLRQIFYALKLFKQNELPCPVLSVGNITLGGTGKTPVVIHISELLIHNRRHPAVISRGYGRLNEAETLVVSDGRSVLLDPLTGGDEPVLIGSKLKGVPVVVGRNRHHAALDALHRFNSDVVVLDDGFQHLQLGRTLDIVLVDACDPFGNGKLFPAGILREPLTALGRADAVLITRADQGGNVQQVHDIVAHYTHGKIFTSRFVPLNVVECSTGDILPLSHVRGNKLIVLAGIARPASFISLLLSLGGIVAAECIYPDHYAFKRSDLEDVYSTAEQKKADMIVTTEKDAVRLKHLSPKGIFALSITLSVDEREEWESFVLRGIEGRTKNSDGAYA